MGKAKRVAAKGKIAASAPVLARARAAGKVKKRPKRLSVMNWLVLGPGALFNWLWLFASNGKLPSTFWGVKSARLQAMLESYPQLKRERLLEVGFHYLVSALVASTIWRA